MSAPKHTPLPWHADGPEVMGLDGNGDYADHVATAWNAPGGPEPEGAVANAALIVRAVNAHADLLSACEAVLDWIWPHGGDSDEQREVYDQVCAAIAKAKGA
jgi:hypothetical protein